MTTKQKGKRIVRRIKNEVAAEKANVKKNQDQGDKNLMVCGDLGCSDPGGCSNYCSESAK